MNKIVTWTSSRYSKSSTAHETDSLFYAENVVRYLKFKSPFSIKFCVAEALRYTVGNRQVVVPPGGFFITNRETEMECLPNKPGVQALIVFFTDALIFDVCRNRRLHDIALLDNPLAPVEPTYFFEHVYGHPNALTGQLHALAKQMATSDLSPDSLMPDAFFALAEDMIALQQEVCQQMNRVNARTHATREELYRRLLLAKAYMHDHWHTELNLADIAGNACLSPYHFHRSFREAFGQSPMRWLRQLRIDKAQEMLAEGNWTVTEVAYRCGFSDVFSFSKTFKRERGLAPSVCGRASSF